MTSVSRCFSGGVPRFAGLALAAVLQMGSPAFSQQKPVHPPGEEPLGSIYGHVSIPDIGEAFDAVQAVLMPPEWAIAWRGEVQQRLDSYSQTYRRAIAQDPGLFSEISRAAHQEATELVLARMRAALGASFGNWTTDVSEGGAFRFPDLPFGDYQMVVIARLGTRGMIWAESLSIDSLVPQTVEIENRIQ